MKTANSRGTRPAETVTADQSPLTFTVTATGDIAASLRVVAFVSGKSIETIVLDTLSGMRDRATAGAELFDEAYHQLDPGEELNPMLERFRAYRDANGLGFSDPSIERELAWKLRAAAA